MVTSYQNFIGIDIGKFKNVVAIHKQKNAIENASGWQQLFQEFSYQHSLLGRQMGHVINLLNSSIIGKKSPFSFVPLLVRLGIRYSI